MRFSEAERAEIVKEMRRIASEPNRFRVIPYRTRWIVGSMNPDYTRFFRSQDAAVEHARELARKSEGELVIHRRDGDVEERVSFRKSSAQA